MQRAAYGMQHAGQPIARPDSALIMAVGLLAVDGFAIAFGRIVQYQSIVMLMMLGAFWCCWRFSTESAGSQRYLVGAAVLLAVGLLAHYDAVLVAPALAWLVLVGARRRGWQGADWPRHLLLPTLVGAGLLACFFLPYVLSESFASTADYLAGRAGEGDAGGPPFNNLPLYLQILAFYNGPLLVPILVVLVLVTCGTLLVAYVRPLALGWGLAAGLAAAALVQWLAPEWLALAGGRSWAGLAFGVPLLGLGLAPGVPAKVRAVGLWFAVALGAQAFLIAEPRTHFYTAHVPAALLVGLVVTAPTPEARASARHWLVSAAVALAVVGGALYGQLVYLRQVPEYQRVFPAARPDVLRASYGDALPEAGYFGFPHRDGWKAAAELLRTGVLRGSYDTNQNRWLAGWYLRGVAAQCKGEPELYLIAEAESTVYFPPGYHRIAEVWVGPARALAVYGREPPQGAPQRYALETLAPAFDTRPLNPFNAGALLNEEPPQCTP